jgi:hypothetical protein
LEAIIQAILVWCRNHRERTRDTITKRGRREKIGAVFFSFPPFFAISSSFVLLEKTHQSNFYSLQTDKGSVV